jgi:23S rRNA G2445 N2-methylase RlmL
VTDPGFTPSLRDIGRLVDLLADDDLAKHAERAIARAGAGAVPILRDRFVAEGPAFRAAVVRALGRFAGDPGARGVLLGALEDSDPKTRRNAAIALGRAPAGDPAPDASVGAEAVERSLLAAWERDPRPEMRRSIAASLGKVGSARSLPVLRSALASAAAPGDPELVRIAGRATLMIERTASRGERGTIDATRTPPAPIAVIVLARRGLEDLLADELAAVQTVRDVRVEGSGCVRAVLRGPMSALFAARTMLSFRFPVSTEAPTGPGSDGPNRLEEVVARAASGEEARRVFSTWTVGPTRYRIDWAEGGHKRALAWETVKAVARLAPDLVNDPTASLWELHVAAAGGRVDVAIAPRALQDPRFGWRRRDVPAASHPTVAAALVRVAGVRADDVVWDPFVGSGAELVERARLGPFASLRGSDIDRGALDAARENLAAAGAPCVLEQGDALTHAPPGVTLVVTNPPMGRRASRTSELAGVLDRFVAHAASVLVSGGRLVWMAPHPKRARAAALAAGLVLDWSRTVDMGGFDAEMQRFTKP